MTQGIIDNLVERLTLLPGIGRKSAQRLAFFLHTMPEGDAKSIADAIYELKDKARFCSRCFNITNTELCNICSSNSRDGKKLCVVEEPSNIMVFERSGSYNGVYHVLLGALSPLDGITPDRLKIKELVERVRNEGIEEVIIATNPTTKGEMTAHYLKDALEGIDSVSITRIAYGLPMGGDIEFADEVTLKKSLEGRREI